MYRESASIVPGAIRWLSTADGGEKLVLPDGCMDLIWIGDELTVAGPDRIAFRHRTPEGQPFIGLRLAPGTLSALLGVPAQELVGIRVPASEMGVRLPGRDRIRALETWVGDRLHLVPQWLAYATGSLAAGRPVSAIADEIGISERHFRRIATARYGYGPKHLHRVVRLQRALGSELSAADAAVAAGYSDQAHLAREIRELTGSTWTSLTSAR